MACAIDLVVEAGRCAVRYGSGPCDSEPVSCEQRSVCLAHIEMTESVRFAVHPRMPRTAVLPCGVTQLSEVYATVMYQKYQKYQKLFVYVSSHRDAHTFVLLLLGCLGISHF